MRAKLTLTKLLACEYLCTVHISYLTIFIMPQLHAEAGKGQFEIALKHASCILAADKLIYAREVIKSVARKHGLLATFVPK